MKYYIYCWTNTITNKSYIGYTGQSILKRWKKHLQNAANGSMTYFYKSIRKYGANVWLMEELAETNTIEEALLLEKKFIKQMNTLAPNGYNSADGGAGGNTWYGPKVIERKKNLSESVSGINNPNFSGYSDEQILDAAIQFYKDNSCQWDQNKWSEYCKKFKYPQYLTKFRFANFGGGEKGFKKMLCIELEKQGYNIENIFCIPKEQIQQKNKKISEVLKAKGSVWATNIETGKSLLIHPSKIDGIIIIKGRNKKC